MNVLATLFILACITGFFWCVSNIMRVWELVILFELITLTLIWWFGMYGFSLSFQYFL